MNLTIDWALNQALYYHQYLGNTVIIYVYQIWSCTISEQSKNIVSLALSNLKFTCPCKLLNSL